MSLSLLKGKLGEEKSSKLFSYHLECKPILFVHSNLQMLPIANAFYRGMSDLISPSWLKLFNANEFNQVFSSHI